MKRPLPMKLRELQDTYRKNEYMLRPYLLKDGNVHPVAIICPGGGYRRVCSFIEGHPYARKLNKMGYHAVVVYYRVRNQAVYPKPQEELARAIREVRSHAQQWKLDMEGYSLWGSSAGGHLAGSFGTEAMGWKQFGLPRPGAVILSYPVVTMGTKTHQSSKNYHIGAYASEEYVNLTSIEKQITESYPPTFLWWGDCDSTVDPDNSRMLKAALEESGVPCICREYKGVDHGIGIGKGLPCEGWFEDAVQFWMNHR